MNSIINKVVAFFWRPLQASLPRFPEAILTAFLLGILAIINNELNEFNLVLNDINRSLFLLVPLFIILTILRERMPNLGRYRWWLFSLAILLTGLFFVFLQIETQDAVEWNRFSNLLYACYGLVIIAPYVMGKNQLETGIVLFFTKLFTAMLYAGVLYVGIFILLISANVLFNLSLRLIVYANLFILITAFVFLPILLGSYPKDAQRITVAKDFHPIWQKMFAMVIAPVISVFIGLIFIYLVTGIVNADTYEAEVYTFSALVIAFAGISTQVALTPFHDKNRLTRVYHRYFHVALLIVMMGYYFEQFKTISMMGMSLSVMIQLLLGIWPVSYVIFKFQKHPKAVQKGLLMLVGTFTFIAAAPGLNAVSLTTYWLQGQYQQILVSQDMLASDGTITPINPLPATIYDQLFYTMDEMDRLGLKRFSLIPEGYQHPRDFDTTFGFKAFDPTDPDDEFLNYQLMVSVLDLSSLAYDQLIYVSSIHELKAGESFVVPPLTLTMAVDTDTHSYLLGMTTDAATESIDLYQDVALAFQEKFASDNLETTSKEDLKLTFTFNAFTIDLWVLTLMSNRFARYSDMNMGFYLGVQYHDA
jgi:hypothetical protein